MPFSNPNNNFLSDASEMGKMILEKDWSATSLGHPSNWPLILRNTVSVILDNPLGMYIAWGKEYIQIYNDGFRPLFASNEHSNALGNTAQATFKQSWHILKPMFDRAMEGYPFRCDEFKIPIYLNGSVEECYYNLSFGPIRNDDGTIGGVLLAVFLMDNKKMPDQREKVGEDQWQIAVDSAELATFDYNPITDRLIGNSRLRQWFGLPLNGDWQFSNIIQAVDEVDKKYFIDALEKFLKFETAGKFEMEYSIVHPINKDTRTVRATGKVLFNDDKVAHRIIGAIKDVTEQAIAQNKTAQSEKNLRNMVLQAPMGICILDAPSLKCEIVNELFLSITKKNRDSIFDKFYWDSFSEQREKYENSLKKVIDGGLAYYVHEVELSGNENGSNETTYITFVFSPLKNENDKVIKLVVWTIDNTEQVMAKKKIQKSENDLRSMIKQAPVSITIIHGPEHRVAIINAIALKKAGRTEAEVLNMPLFEIAPELESQGLKDILDNVYYKGDSFTATELPLQLLKNGELETSYTNVTMEPLYGASGEITGIMSISVEVTAQVLARQKVEAYGEKLNLILASSELGTWEVNLKTDKVDCSDRCLEILGLPGKFNLTHEELLENMHPEDLNVRKKAFEEANSTGYLHYKARVVWKDRKVRWLEVTGKTFYDKNKEPDRMLGTIRDISKERLFQQQLMEREQKFRLLADSMPQNVWTSDSEGNLNYFNRSVYIYSGLSNEELQKAGWLQIVHPEDKKDNESRWSHSIATGENFLIEHRFRRYDGEYRWFLSRAIPQRDASQNITMWVGTSTDIQDQKSFTKELENQVRERTQELNQKNVNLKNINKELQSFAYVSSHDLQEPLRKIQIFAGRIMNNELETLSENGKNYFNRIQNSAKRMQNLIDDLLAYSRTNDSEGEFTLVPLRDIIDGVCEDLVDEIKEKNTVFETLELCDVNIIPFQFHQLFFNLMTNSLKFVKPNHPPHITITAENIKGDKISNENILDHKEYCHIRYSDNGIGFDPKYSNKVFELFQRLHSKSDYDGTGIGLSIVKKIVENHEGFITAMSEINNGVTFNIYIPK